MRLTLDLHDDLAETYRREADTRDLPVESVLEDRLVAATRLDPRTRHLVLTQPTLGELEETLGGGHLQTQSDLTAKVRRLAAIRFGDHTLPITPGQMEELAWRATKQGKTIEQMLTLAYERFAEQFFTLVP